MALELYEMKNNTINIVNKLKLLGDSLRPRKNTRKNTIFRIFI